MKVEANYWLQDINYTQALKEFELNEITGKHYRIALN